MKQTLPNSTGSTGSTLATQATTAQVDPATDGRADTSGDSLANMHHKRRPITVVPIALLASLLVWLMWTVCPFGLMYDPNKDKCLPDLHLSLSIKGQPKALTHGDLVYWKPGGALSYVKQPFVLKQVAAVSGDRLQIQGDKLLVNSLQVGAGLPLVNVYRTSVALLQRDELVPPGKVFVIGQNRLSDDSRYWGYLDRQQIVGQAYKLW